MTFRIIAPYVSCVVNEAFETPKDTLSEFDEAVNSGYPNIYMITSSGIILHQSFAPGKGGKQRYIRTPVKEIPGLKLKQVQSRVNFLPDGKIPIRILDEVKAFFKKVIEKRGTAVEAMIWVLWDEARGYHLFVPNQVVSHASARYDWSTLPVGSIIVVDIHSHADFNAFFSGTDNKDDSGSIRYSGVIGHNNTDRQDTVWRFNCQSGPIEAKMDDLFETAVVNQPEIPEDWLNKVQAPAPALSSVQKGYVPGQGKSYSRHSGMNGSPSKATYVNGKYVDPDEPEKSGNVGYQSTFFGNSKGNHGSPFSSDSVEMGRFGKLDRGPWSKKPGLGIQTFDDSGIPDEEYAALAQEGGPKKKVSKKSRITMTSLKKRALGQTTG